MISIALAGGGTAGHTSPLIATAEALRAVKPDVSITCVGTPKGIESRVIPAAGLDLQLVPAVPLPRTPGIDLATMPGRLSGAVLKARRILRRAGAQAVVGFGGYASLPVYLAAQLLRLPVVVHEQNALPGVANRVGARFATAVCVSFPNTGLRNQQFIGLPVRASIAGLDRAARRPAARETLGLPQEGPVLLVSGGSQGAARLNSATQGALDELLAAGVSVLHVLGPKNLTGATMSRSHVGTGARYQPVGYVDAMEDAYAAADLMVGRSGAGTVVETAVVGLPTILVPLPHGNGEQARNATSLVAAGGARLVADKELTSQRLLSEVLPLVTDAAALARMARAGQDLVPRDAAATLARIVIEAAR
ncbi:MAG: undecaprenyldiphospho-muramoylpentapeptide beta-N-acetylglucosaminyltransferase [Actinomycetia bacterium]|nr:undecaprenyldiphospho-muramoylpentapeptide beta-N-acetylglucosaminyltransferase [Actinomycetes bacterium]